MGSLLRAWLDLEQRFHPHVAATSPFRVSTADFLGAMWLPVATTALYIAAFSVVTCCYGGCFCCCCRPCRRGKDRTSTTVVRGHLGELVDVDNRVTSVINDDPTYTEYFKVQEGNKYYE